MVEPSFLEDFIGVLIATFQTASTTYLDALIAFSSSLGESPYMLGIRFNLIAMPLEGS